MVVPGWRVPGLDSQAVVDIDHAPDHAFDETLDGEDVDGPREVSVEVLRDEGAKA